MSKSIATLWALLLLTTFTDDTAARPIAFGPEADNVNSVSNHAPCSADALTKPDTGGGRITRQVSHRCASAIHREKSRLSNPLPTIWRALERVFVRPGRACARLASVRGPPLCLSTAPR